MPGNGGTSLRDHPREADRDGRVHAQGLVEAGQEIRQRADAGKVDLVFRLERAPDLGREFLHGLGVGQEQVRHPGEQRGRRFRPADDEDGAVGLEFLECQALSPVRSQL